MKTKMLIISTALAAMSAVGGVKDEVHGYTPKGYVQPKEPEVRDYGKVDIIWLDGGQVQRRRGLDIGIEDIIAEARKYNPALISVDRTADGNADVLRIVH